MPISDPMALAESAEAAYGPEVKERYANTYYVSPSDFDLRIAFGTKKLKSDGTDAGVQFNTAVYLDYKLAKDLVSAMQILIEKYESIYGSADIIQRDPGI